MSGVLSVGIGDSAASFVGSNWGKRKWTNSDKSIEGTIACIVSQIVVIIGLTVLGKYQKHVFYCIIENLRVNCNCKFLGHVEGPLLVRSIFSVILVSLVEAHTKQIDNLALPFLMYLCLTV